MSVIIRIAPAVFKLVTSGNLPDLKAALQHAIELEHATMPPYLYALFSLGSGNPSIRKVLRRIVREEMLHMLLAANLFKAIGGQPVIDKPDFVPSYPTALPGTVAADLIVPLRPFSRSLVAQTFMRIEEPEHPLEFEITSLGVSDAPAATIGEFYQRIRNIFDQEGDALIVDKTGSTQPSTFEFATEQTVTSAAKALHAIDLIVEQGEGTTTTPFFPDGDDVPDNDQLAHYYCFAELVKGRLKKNPNAAPDAPPEQKFVYDANDPVPFDETRVLLLPDNPKAIHYPEGGPARALNDDFNRIYTGVLKLLHQAFNSNPARLDDAIGLMADMSTAARALTNVSVGSGMVAGPTFQYLP